MTAVPITKMVNDLFLQWLSQEDTRKNLFAGLQIVRSGGKLPEPNYPKSYHTTTTRGGGFSKSQHFDSPPVSPVPRSSSSPRSGERKRRKRNTLNGSQNGANSEQIRKIKYMFSQSVPCQIVRTSTCLYFNVRIDQTRRRSIHFCEQCRYHGRYCDAIHKGFCRPVSTPLARISISPKIPKSHINFVFEKRYPADQIQQHIQHQIRQKFTHPEAIWPLKSSTGNSTNGTQSQTLPSQHRSAVFIPEVTIEKNSSQIAKSVPVSVSGDHQHNITRPINGIGTRAHSPAIQDQSSSSPTVYTSPRDKLQQQTLSPTRSSPSRDVSSITSPQTAVSTTPSAKVVAPTSNNTTNSVVSLRDRLADSYREQQTPSPRSSINSKSPSIQTTVNNKDGPTETIKTPSQQIRQSAGQTAVDKQQEIIPAITTTDKINRSGRPSLSQNESPVETIETRTSTTPQQHQSPTKPQQKQDLNRKTTVIPRFYFPNGSNAESNSSDVITKQLKKVKEELFQKKNDKLYSEDFGAVAQSVGLSLYWKAPLFRACMQDVTSATKAITSNHITYQQFETFWKKICKTNYDNASKFICLMASKPNVNYLVINDWEFLVQDIIDTHPGLKFLREAKEFHSRYVKTVIARVYYNVNRSWSNKLTAAELRRSNFLQTLDRIEQEEDINRIHDYFSYEHFYVIYCKFWELDSDHDLFISRDDLAKHNNGAISNKMIDRIFSGAVSNSENMKQGKMSYYEFVWFLISEEDKRSQTSIEYWFRCMDLDGDGILSMFELDYFYQEQVHKMEIYGIEYMPFEDAICQMLDLVKPEDENKIRLKDLKRCKLTNVFFDTFFNLEKYLDNEQKDPFSNVKDPDLPEVSDWVKFAEAEYDNLTHEDGGNENMDDVNYDEDFEEDDGDGNGSTHLVASSGNNSNVSALSNAVGTMNLAESKKLFTTTMASRVNNLNNTDDLEEELKRWKD
ncbi:unnamed protein product [Didymodactylos carnosus]|uniref:EF-hand domain-containing protein n=1 Tax=Didymodactylos carnosus TaxID=1234261 RepID=A0A814NKG0_9BILA|nr:unnamed protein product [Didymodactylos carnosus]CAF1094963.1 unnamed protein product [Didymodactylos carnosus]CAF3687868.1 unnamed protein product [Didymodactylos carnosus]CAF3860337.1 unnamed protein product [Didymodactylos carnosus]